MQKKLLYNQTKLTYICRTINRGKFKKPVNKIIHE
jgi:hypothetical protein